MHILFTHQTKCLKVLWCLSVLECLDMLLQLTDCSYTIFLSHCNYVQPLSDELQYVQICGSSFLRVFTSKMPYAVSVSFLFRECFNYENLVLNCTSQCKSSRIWTLKQEIWANRTLSYNHKDHSMFTDCMNESLSHQHVMQCSWIIELTYIRATKLSVKREVEMAA